MDDPNAAQKPLTTEDLYGKTKPDDLVYEETPEIEPLPSVPNPDTSSHPLQNEIPTPPVPEQQTDITFPQPQSMPSSNLKKHNRFPIGIVFLLFALGLGGMYLVQTYGFPKPQIKEPVQNTDVLPTASDRMDVQEIVTPASSPSATAQPKTPTQKIVAPTISTLGAKGGVYQLSDLGFNGWSVTLPAAVNVPVCDGSSCQSKGTYLPGGTRFTVYKQSLTASDSEFTKTIVTDAYGKDFDMMVATVSGKPSLGFFGSFAGTTTGGYSFTRMKGVLLLVGPKTALGLNHFSPSGITADFNADDAVFDAIVKSLKQTSP